MAIHVEGRISCAVLVHCKGQTGSWAPWTLRPGVIKTRNVLEGLGSLLDHWIAEWMIVSFIKMLFGGPIPMNEEAIGKAAGDLWKLLAEQGPIPFRELARSLDEDRDLVAMAVGWLSRENKVSFAGKGKDLVLALREHELAKSGV